MTNMLDPRTWKSTIIGNHRESWIDVILISSELQEIKHNQKMIDIDTFDHKMISGELSGRRKYTMKFTDKKQIEKKLQPGCINFLTPDTQATLLDTQAHKLHELLNTAWTESTRIIPMNKTRLRKNINTKLKQYRKEWRKEIDILRKVNIEENNEYHNAKKKYLKKRKELLKKDQTKYTNRAEKQIRNMVENGKHWEIAKLILRKDVTTRGNTI